MKPGGLYVDGTLGLGGHAAELLRRSAPEGRLIGSTATPRPSACARESLATFGARVRFVHADFREIPSAARGRAGRRHPARPGRQLAAARRRRARVLLPADGPLDMRMDQSHGATAADVVNRLREHELADLIYRFGEERASRRIAKAIVTARRKAPHPHHGRARGDRAPARRPAPPGLDPATRTFQALRIRVNRELEDLDETLAALARCLAPGGRLAVIAFHSLEDREVKQAFRGLEPEGFRRLTRKPLRPTDDEVRAQPAGAQRAPARAPARGGLMRDDAFGLSFKSIDNSRVIREVDPRANRDLWWLLLLVGVLVGGILLYAWPHLQLRRTGIATEQASRERERLLEENRKLRLEKAALENLKRVETIATRDLGLVASSRGQAGRGGDPAPLPADARLASGKPAAPVQGRSPGELAMDRSPSPPPPWDPAPRERMIHLRLMLLALGAFALGPRHRGAPRPPAGPGAVVLREAERAPERAHDQPRTAPRPDPRPRTAGPSRSPWTPRASTRCPRTSRTPPAPPPPSPGPWGSTPRRRRDLAAQLQKSRAFVWVKRKVDPGTARAVRDLQLDGIGFLNETRRYYPQRELMSQVLGYVGLDNTGMSGIEYAFEDRIQGRAAKVVVQTDARRRPMGQTKRPSTDGQTRGPHPRRVDPARGRARARAGGHGRARRCPGSWSWWTPGPARSWPWPTGRPSTPTASAPTRARAGRTAR